MMLSPSKTRILSALRGAFCADAASMGTHWIYNPQEMLQQVSSVEAPEFKTPPTPRFYSSTEFPGHYDAGMLSPYGEQLEFVTSYVARAADVNGLEMSQQMLDWATTCGCRLDGAMKKFIENMKAPGTQWPNCGADDSEAHIYMKIVPVVCRYAGQSVLLEKVSEAIKVHQNNAKAVGFGYAAARILEGVLLGGSLGQVLATCEENLSKDISDPDILAVVAATFPKAKAYANEYKDLDAAMYPISHELMEGKEDSPFYDLAGRSCATPGSFVGPLFLLYKASTGTFGENPSDWYAAALRQNILASGDTCSRSVFVGAVLAAVADGVPENWMNKVDPKVSAMVEANANAIVELVATIK